MLSHKLYQIQPGVDRKARMMAIRGRTRWSPHMMIRISEKGNKLLQDGYGHTIQVSTRRKPTDLSQATDKLDHIM
jgi:hypothetical protein